jgi:hypothetical protein
MRTDLPGEVIGQSCRLGEKIFERRALDFFHLAAGAITGIEIILEERSEVDFLEGIFLFDGGDGILFVGSRWRRGRGLPLFVPTSSINGTDSSSSSRTGFSTISLLIMSLSSSLLSARTETICTRPGVRIWRWENLTLSLCCK